MSETMNSTRWGRDVTMGTVAGHPCKVYVQRPRSLAELLVDAQRWGDRDFVVQGERRLTGAQHAQAAMQVADLLRSQGLGRGSRILLHGYNHIEWLLAFWAIHLIGGTAVLGNAWWSDEELQSAVELVTPAIIITDRTVGLVDELGPACIRFSELRGQLAETETSELRNIVPPDVDEEDPAVVIFSSGTTGKAKGVVMSHRGIIANVQNLLTLTGRLPSELAADHAGTVSLVSMPLFHLAGMQITLMNMLCGGRLVFLQGKFDPLEVLGLIQQERVRAWGSVPTMVSRVIQHPEFKNFDTTSVSSVQMGGAAIPPSLREEVRAAFPRTAKRVGSLYGLTEAGGVLAAGSGADLEGRPGCVGKPLPTVDITLRNRDANGAGEIAARVPSATSGYIGDATPIADPEGWVLTGDLGRFDDEGFLYIVGRSKDTIIRGGENIASVHVEDILRSHPDVLDVAVVPLPHSDLGEEVGAVVVLREGSATDAQALRVHAVARLAKFEVPSRWWLRTESLPTNASGKTLKRELIANWPPSATQGEVV